MQFKSLADLGRDLADWSAVLPQDIDLIVGIPRSGMLAATLLALHLQKPLIDLDGYISGGDSFEGGFRTGHSLIRPGIPRKVLVLDDSVASGYAMRRAKSKISAGGVASDQVLFGAVYALPENTDFVDVFAKVVEGPRVFEWNLFHHRILAESCMDIDGVLCRDPSMAENDDGARYVNFVKETPARVVPSIRVGHLVSARTEKYRELTEVWMKRYGVQYGELHLYPGTTKERRARGDHADFKARVYRATGAKLFIESDPTQAARIANLTGRPVLCIETMRLLPGGLLHESAAAIHNSQAWPIRGSRIVWRRIRAVGRRR